MKPDLIKQYIVPSLATLKEKMKHPRPGIHSTRKKIEEVNCEPVEIASIKLQPSATKTMTIPPDKEEDSNKYKPPMDVVIHDKVEDLNET